MALEGEVQTKAKYGGFIKKKSHRNTRETKVSEKINREQKNVKKSGNLIW